jgi:hypothetical protein
MMAAWDAGAARTRLASAASRVDVVFIFLSDYPQNSLFSIVPPIRIAI